MPRPLFQASAAELEGLFERHKDDAEQLAVLLAELEHRSLIYRPKGMRRVHALRPEPTDTTTPRPAEPEPNRLK